MVMKLVQMEGLWSDWMKEIEIELEEKKLGEDSKRQEIELSNREEEKLDQKDCYQKRIDQEE